MSRRTCSLSALTIAAFASGFLVGSSADESQKPHEVAAAPAPANITLPSEEAQQPVAREVRPVRPNLPTPVVHTATNARPDSFRGSLIVASNPSGALVSLNGRSAGRTPLVLKGEAAGSRAVRVELDGYASWTTVVRIVSGTETRLSATLEQTPGSSAPQ